MALEAGAITRRKKQQYENLECIRKKKDEWKSPHYWYYSEYIFIPAAKTQCVCAEETVNTHMMWSWFCLERSDCQCKQLMAIWEEINLRVAEEHCAWCKFCSQLDGSGKGKPGKENRWKVMVPLDRDAGELGALKCKEDTHSKYKKYCQGLADRIKQIKESEKHVEMTWIFKSSVYLKQRSVKPLEENKLEGKD